VKERSSRLVVILRWIARILSIISIGFVLLFLVGEVLPPHAEAVFKFRDILAMIFFPIGVCFGLGLAWRREPQGGTIAIGCVAAFYLILFLFDGRFPRGPYFFLLASPGLLFVAAWGVERIALAKHST
jgi:hypothetical protein